MLQLVLEGGSVATSDVLRSYLVFPEKFLMSDVLAINLDVDWAIGCVFHISSPFRMKIKQIRDF